MSSKPLSTKDRAFADEYLSNGYNATAAYSKTHPNATIDSARAQGCETLARPNIREYLRKAAEESLDKVKDTLKKRIIEKYMVRAFYDIDEIIDPETGTMIISKEELKARGLSCVIDSINRKDTKDASNIEYKFADRDKALAELMKFMQVTGLGEVEDGETSKDVFVVHKVSAQEWADFIRR